MNQDELKAQTGQESVNYIKSGMIVGLGTGSTVRYMVDELGKRVQAGELTGITGVTTSSRTAKQAKDLGITIKDIDDVDHIDLCIDGADEVSDDFQGIKGGGGALLWEKIVANASDKIIWIVDESKLVHQLGKFPLPIEVIPFGAQLVFNRLEKKGYKPSWRMDGSNKFLTDEKNYIIDLHLGKIDHPAQLADELIHMVGVVESGLFLNRVNDVIVGTQNGPKILHAR
ncbi:MULTISPECIES: ribose-5-phosphate isomerase RpiA [Limosilactobacillus]|jgi:ribose 5-phosphate isomerase A|uniref:Ribose-5-phosphate isomerase A n=1 Tax=Limosilactobacillus panis DSM 6035 TaxID=1423782 RepID=A0A0R1XMD0_9LACO|nr:ribose-5-phosphate isomerase RpiA [Limosilactobacillus panis]KRM29636.1 ribose 5-phosphate isomerase A [Limosilactobacillus panis DSM 6035]QZN93425.1 ribose-5-phosphate isomerase RpiA [Limosilactobacillus panis]